MRRHHGVPVHEWTSLADAHVFDQTNQVPGVTGEESPDRYCDPTARVIATALTMQPPETLDGLH